MPGNITRRTGANSCANFIAAVQDDPEIRALTVSEAVEANAAAPAMEGIFPASWINANFDVWIGHAEDVRAWDLLRDAREVYARNVERLAGGSKAGTETIAARV